MNGVITIGNQLRQPIVHEHEFDTRIRINEIECSFERSVVITEWYHNNTKKIFAEGTIENYGIRVSITQFTKIVKEEEPVRPLGVFPGKYTWDNLIFLPKGDNGTHLVKYTHDDNYDTYYPREWFTHWDIPVGTMGNQKTHVHLSYQEVQDWIQDTERTSDILEHVWAGATIGLGALAAVAAYLSCGLIALVSGILAAIAGIMALIVWYQGWQMKAWIEDIVQAHNGDGWCWYWSTYHLGSDRRSHSCWYRWMHTEWYMSWGAQRDEPQLISVEWREANPLFSFGGGVPGIKRSTAT